MADQLDNANPNGLPTVQAVVVDTDQQYSQQSLVQNGPVSQTSSSQVSMSSWSSSSVPSSSQVSSISSDENDGALRIDVTSVTYNSTDVRACQVQLVRCEIPQQMLSTVSAVEITVGSNISIRQELFEWHQEQETTSQSSFSSTSSTTDNVN